VSQPTPIERRLAEPDAVGSVVDRRDGALETELLPTLAAPLARNPWRAFARAVIVVSRHTGPAEISESKESG